MCAAKSLQSSKSLHRRPPRRRKSGESFRSCSSFRCIAVSCGFARKVPQAGSLSASWYSGWPQPRLTHALCLVFPSSSHPKWTLIALLHPPRCRDCRSRDLETPHHCFPFPFRCLVPALFGKSADTKQRLAFI